jgi:hypothetical protein
VLERNLGIAVARAEDISYFFGRPIAVGLMLITLAIIAASVWRRMIAKRSDEDRVSESGASSLVE